jgi:uncharacterized protein (DUF1330 family)
MSNHISPSETGLHNFAALTLDGPIQMLNLVRLNTDAAYPDGRTATGAQAFATYQRETAPIFQAHGGTIIWQGAPRAVLIGPDSETWDIAFIAEYPGRDNFMAMVADPAYRAVAIHRAAAVRTARLICLSPPPAAPAFTDRAE